MALEASPALTPHRVGAGAVFRAYFPVKVQPSSRLIRYADGAGFLAGCADVSSFHCSESDTLMTVRLLSGNGR